MALAIKETFFLRAYSWLKIPLLFFASPRVVALDADRCEVVIPFLRRNKNHLGSMYFGALCIGADVAGGLIAARLLRQVKSGKGSLIFKDFEARFLRRPEGDTHFICEAGQAISEAVQRAEQSGERVDVPVPVRATVPSLSGNDSVAEFRLTLSVKVKREA